MCVCKCPCWTVTVRDSKLRKLRREKKSFHISFSISGGESYCVLIREKDEIIKAVYSLVSLLGSQRSVCFLISFSPSSAFGTSFPSPFLHPFSKPVCQSFLSVLFNLPLCLTCNWQSELVIFESLTRIYFYTIFNIMFCCKLLFFRRKKERMTGLNVHTNRMLLIENVLLLSMSMPQLFLWQPAP